MEASLVVAEMVDGVHHLFGALVFKFLLHLNKLCKRFLEQPLYFMYHTTERLVCLMHSLVCEGVKFFVLQFGCLDHVGQFFVGFFG